jgi:uncharacterized protein (DUF697 family)/predicted GTPase
MALKKAKIQELLTEINNLFDLIPLKMSAEQRNYIKETILGQAIREIEDIIVNGRPPRMMLVGRSGHGKSSVINALAGKKVTDVSDVRPGQAVSIPLYVEFPEYGSNWEFIDTRGYFDPTKPKGVIYDNAEEQLIQDILRFKPDVFLHVINIKELRTLSNDIETFKRIRRKTDNKDGKTKSLIILSHCDILGRRNEWPIESFPSKAAQVIEAMEYLKTEILNIEDVQFINKDSKLNGLYLPTDDTYLGIIPISSVEEDLWNIDTLIKTIGQYLPREAMYDFFQVARDISLLKELSSSLIKRFSGIAFGIGATPIPVADIAVLTPLQILLTAIISMLSGREISSSNLTPVYEFFAAVGINIGAGLGLRILAQQLIKFIPFAGNYVSGSIASSATYAIGKSAEAYFFNGEKIKPSEIKLNN